MEQLSGLDASFLFFESQRTPMHIGGIAIYDPSTAPGGKVRFKEIIRFIEERMHRAKSFRQRVVNVPFNLDFPYWIEDPDFDIEFHIRHVALPQPGDWRQLCIQAARIHARPLDLTKPLWEFTVVEGLDNVAGVPKGSYAIITKVHHAAIDGVSGVDMTTATHSFDVVDEVETPKHKWVPERVPTAGELLARAYGNAVMQPLKIARLAAQSVPTLAKVATSIGRGELKMPTPPNAVPRTRFNRVVSPHRVVDSVRFDLAEISDMRKRQYGATVNDIVLTIVGGALRNYLVAKNELPSEPLVAMAPVSVRSEGERGAMGNQVTAMSVSLGTHVSDPVGRLQFVQQSALDSKALTKAVGARQLADYTKFLSPVMTGLASRLYMRMGLANRFYPVFNTVVTNVPGPQVPLYSNGARLVTQHGLGPVFDGLGLFHPVFSYCGHVNISINACRDMMPDPEFYAECMRESFAQLKAGLGKRPLPAVDKAAAEKPQKSKTKKAASRSSAKKAPAAKKTAVKKAAVKKAATKRKTPKAKPADAAQAVPVGKAANDDQADAGPQANGQAVTGVAEAAKASAKDTN